jgi:hypothetical protein
MFRKYLAVSVISTWVLCSSHGASANLIVNGDFEAGNVGFTTDYTVDPSLMPPSIYVITTNPNLQRGDAANYGDHTTGSGLMMAVNGSTTAGDVVWEQTVAVSAGATYDFAAYISSWIPGAPADLRFVVNGTEIGSLVAPGVTGIWDVEFATWSSGAATSATIQILNAQLAFGGNDFALDDIFFGDPIFSRGVPVPGTLALFAAGVLAWGLRRRGAGGAKRLSARPEASRGLR